MVYLPDADDQDTLYVFATNSGAPSNPDWYRNLVASGEGTVEVGTETYPVSIRELTGAERDGIYEEQARRNPVLAEYTQKTAGIRAIPVLALTMYDGRLLEPGEEPGCVAARNRFGSVVAGDGLAAEHGAGVVVDGFL
jgi:deazaflavin-dependent oxidoreductase (nitroreductase family)